eukprot:1758845-Rhodomonas_salina.1
MVHAAERGAGLHPVRAHLPCFRSSKVQALHSLAQSFSRVRQQSLALAISGSCTRAHLQRPPEPDEEQ